MSRAAEPTLDVQVRIPARDNGAASLDIDVTFALPPGITILYGPSGSGKTTTLGAIAGLVKPAKGRVSAGGELWLDTERGVDRPAHERAVSFVFQSSALFPHLTALGNVEFAVDRAVGKSERRDRARAMLERMKVGHLCERQPRTLSGGEAQRVALARAFVRQPRVVLLDEAFSAMDRDLRRELTAEVRAFVEEHRVPALLVTHHVMEARAVAERALLIRAGRVEANGSVAELLPMRRSLDDEGHDGDGDLA